MRKSHVKIGGGGRIVCLCFLLFWGWAGTNEFSQAGAADYTLADGETKTMDSFSTTDNFYGPTGEGTSATLKLNNSSEIRFYSGNITGNIDLYHTGANVRTYNSYNAGVTPFRGNVYLQGGNVYLSTGKELGTGTIYLQSNGQLVNEGSQKEGNFTRNCVIDNNIVLSNTSTSGVSTRTIRGGWNIPDGGTASMTLNGIIADDPDKGGAHLLYQSPETTPAVIYINGANTYTQGTTFNSDPPAGTSLLDHSCFVLGNNSALGTGAVTTQGVKVAVDVSGITSLANPFTLKANETIIRNTGANAVVLGADANYRTAWDLQSGKKLIFENTGTGSLTLGRNTSTEGWILTGNGTVQFNHSATVYLQNKDNTAISFIGPNDAGEKLSLTFHQGDWGAVYTGKLSGNIDLFIRQATRFINASSDFTGKISTSANIYFGTGSEMGNKKSNTITMSAGQIVNQGQSNPVIPNDIMTTGNGDITIRAGWNIKEYGGGDRSSLTLTGDISGTRGIHYKGETNAGAIYLRGNNSYTGNTLVGYAYNASTSASHRCWFGIGSDTAFSNGTVTLDTAIPTTVFNLETGVNQDRTLNNSIVISRNRLQFSNSGVGDGVINSSITGDSAYAIEFGSSKQEENVGRLFFNGETDKNAVVNPSATLGGTGTVGDLQIMKDATLYLSTEMNGIGNSAFTIQDILTINGTIYADLDALINSEISLLTASSTVLGEDAAFIFNNLTSVDAGTELVVMKLGTDITAEDFLGRITVYGAGSGWNYALSDDGVLSLTLNVPEPGTGVLLLLGLGALFFWKKRRTR